LFIGTWAANGCHVGLLCAHQRAIAIGVCSLWWLLTPSGRTIAARTDGHYIIPGCDVQYECRWRLRPWVGGWPREASAAFPTRYRGCSCACLVTVRMQPRIGCNEGV